MDPAFDDGFKDIFKTWCNTCRRYVNPWEGHECLPPGETEVSHTKLENWLGDFEID